MKNHRLPDRPGLWTGSPAIRSVAAHDLKSLAGLLAMTVANARRHRADPVFIDDLLVTLDGAVAKLDRIVAMLRDEDRAARRIDLAVRLRRLVSERRSAGALVRLRLDGHGDAVVEADPEGLDAALGHLIDNALEAAGGAEIALDRRGRAVMIEVRDHGPGMTPGFVRDSLLTPFVSTRPDGQGLGAHQAKRFADACGGGLEVDSSPGGGTTMRLVLPLSERPPVDSAI
jgi:signal transduction histidine kinase